MKANKAKQVLDILKKKNLTLGSAESITGGLFASTLVSISGCSSVFKGGIVCYSIDSKIKFLGIKKEIIEKYDVVSKEVAELMATNLKSKLGVDIAVSFTGNAGPTCEPGKAKVGTVFIGIAYQNKVDVYKKVFKENREKIRLNVVNFVFDKISEKNFLEKLNFPRIR